MKSATKDTTSAALEVADPTKNLILVPLSQLRPSRRNVRKTNPKLSIPELAASIQRVGLLQNLIVSEPEEGDYYEVEAGGRRLAALKLLAKKKRIAANYEVPCLLVPDASARTVSLTENIQREAMIGYLENLSCTSAAFYSSSTRESLRLGSPLSTKTLEITAQGEML